MKKRDKKMLEKSNLIQAKLYNALAPVDSQ